MLLLTTYPQSARHGPSSRRAGGAHALVLRAMSLDPYFLALYLKMPKNKLRANVVELIIPSAVKTWQA